MNNYLNRISKGFCFALVLVIAGKGYSMLPPDFEDNVPVMCSEASDRQPLPGHILRLGFVGYTHYGWSFFFPDQRIRDNLQRVSIDDNVGLIGQDPSQDFSALIQTRTPMGSFVVAQIFVGDQSVEPVVTCISRPILLQRYMPTYYGEAFRWLNRPVFERWLGLKRYTSWKWKRFWNRDFDTIRKNFRRYWNSDDRRLRFKKFRDKFGDGGRRFRRDNENRENRFRKDRSGRKEQSTMPISGRGGIPKAPVLPRNDQARGQYRPTKKDNVDYRNTRNDKNVVRQNINSGPDLQRKASMKGGPNKNKVSFKRDEMLTEPE